MSKWQSNGEDQADFDDADPRGAEPLSFEELLVFVRAHPIQALDDRFVEELDAGKMRGRFDGSEIVARIPANPDHASNAYSERSYFGVLIDFYPPTPS